MCSANFNVKSLNSPLQYVSGLQKNEKQNLKRMKEFRDKANNSHSCERKYRRHIQLLTGLEPLTRDADWMKRSNQSTRHWSVVTCIS